MVTRVRLQHFRSYKDAAFELGSGVNIIVGPNASGKTNLLEAILVLARGASYRAADADLVAFGADWARLDAQMHDETKRLVKLQMSGPEKAEKTFEIDDQVQKRLSQQKMLPVVLFEPNDLRLVNGEPGIRRDFLDDLAEQLKAGYGDTRRRYRRAR